jgi:hypothetical protein
VSEDKKPIVNVRRPTLELELPKPERKTEIKTREREEGTDQVRAQNQLLAAVGERLKPEGTVHVASFCVHVYAHKMNAEYFFKTQVSGGNRLQEHLAQAALKELGRNAMLNYGRRPPRKRGEMQEDGSTPA